MIIEAATQPDIFTADFTIKVNGLRTKTVGVNSNVVKEVEWTLIGKHGTCNFELPQSTQLPDPIENFIPITDLTESEVINWIENNESRLLGIKAHIQLVLDQQSLKNNLEVVKMPWATEEETTGPASAPSPV